MADIKGWNINGATLSCKDETARARNVPSGGTTGQVLAKASGTDYDTEWVDASGGGGGSVSWGNISGTLSNQTDLNTALAGKADSGHSHSNATSEAAGFLSAADKAVIDGLGDLADHDTVDYSTEVTNKPTLGGIQVRPDYTVSTTDLTDGTSSLAEGALWFYVSQ